MRNLFIIFCLVGAVGLAGCGGPKAFTKGKYDKDVEDPNLFMYTPQETRQG